ncbi:g11434 [Coccomyxa viridis]|uniref:G11434 protein n=1 Tax=Coccomyxa viridis TaxID=1274662 RepID=A0ABP1GAH9_9CHLO
MNYLLLALLGADLFSLGRCAGGAGASPCGSAGQPPCVDENGYNEACSNGTYSQIFYSYDDASAIDLLARDQQVYRKLCLPVPEGTYTIGGPCDPSADKACTPNAADGTTPLNQTARCSFTSILTSKKPGNDSYDRLMEHP